MSTADVNFHEQGHELLRTFLIFFRLESQVWHVSTQKLKKTPKAGKSVAKIGKNQQQTMVKIVKLFSSFYIANFYYLW